MPGLLTTFNLLATTSNVTAVEVLTAALRVPDSRVQLFAIEALLLRRHIPAQIEIIRRLAEFPKSAWDVLDKHKGMLGGTLRQCLLSHEEVLQANALRLTEVLEEYALIPTLLGLIERENDAVQQHVPAVLTLLVNRLHEHLQFGREAAAHPAGRGANQHGPTFLRDAQRIRHQTLASLEASALRFHLHGCLIVVEALFILGDSENILVKRLLRESPDDIREIAEQVLWTSKHPAVLNLICQSLQQNYPLPQALEAFERRQDPEFICHVLQQWPRKLSPVQQLNYHEIHSLPWLSGECLNLEMIPAGLQKRFTAFLAATDLPGVEKLLALEWLVRHGGLDGRLAATEVLAGLQGEQIQQVVLDGLESQVPDVQAWATHQLRACEVPGAIEKLITRLDSPIQEVCAAARAELAGFNIARVLDFYEQLEPTVARAVGRIVQKIDPETMAKLKSEMHHSMQRRRIRAIRCAEKLGLHTELVPQLAALLQDVDPVVRRTAVEVLGKLPQLASDAIAPLLQDASPRVREAAAEALGVAVKDGLEV